LKIKIIDLLMFTRFLFFFGQDVYRIYSLTQKTFDLMLTLQKSVFIHQVLEYIYKTDHKF